MKCKVKLIATFTVVLGNKSSVSAYNPKRILFRTRSPNIIKTQSCIMLSRLTSKLWLYRLLYSLQICQVRYYSSYAIWYAYT